MEAVQRVGGVSQVELKALDPDDAVRQQGRFRGAGGAGGDLAPPVRDRSSAWVRPMSTPLAGRGPRD